MSTDLNDLFQRFFNALNKANANSSGQSNQRKATEEWKELKMKYKDDKNEFSKVIESRIKEFQMRVSKSKAVMLNYFLKDVYPSQSAVKVAPSVSNNLLKEVKSPESNANETVLSDKVNTVDSSKEIDILKKNYDTPAQNQQLKIVHALESQLSSQILSRDSGIADDNSCQKSINATKKELSKAKQVLHKKKNNVIYQRKHRMNMKRKLVNANETLGISSHNKVARPRKEEEQPGLMDAIISIAMFGSAAHDRRRTEEIRSCKTLSELHTALTDMGFIISRSATYLRLLPRNFLSLEGKRHVMTVPVKLCKAQNDIHKTHPDSKFCTASIRYVESLASILGSEQVAFLSQDDKARVPIGLTAAHKQSPLLMHLDYRVQLPDHDWVIAEKHKLIPSVYAGIIIKPYGMGSPDAVTYSGPTYISIRSGKHSSSTAASHAQDFQMLLKLKEFDCVLKTTQDKVKPVLIFTVDGGPDENPRYPKTIAFAIKHFQENDLDALFIVTNAPGRSAYNRVERRMAPLSKQLSGVILRHDTHGSHLDDRGRTIDKDLELKNFESAGNVLAEIWRELVIDGYPVKADYRNPENVTIEVTDVIHNWYATHVRESQYFLQIVKCKNVDCCGSLRSDLHSVLPEGFFPAPCSIFYNTNGKIEATKEVKSESKFLPLFQRLALTTLIPYEPFIKVPYDFYCPSVQSQLKNRCCATCGLYFASKKATTAHMRVLNHSIRWSKRNMKIVSILDKRDNEVLCNMNDEKTGAESTEWIESEDMQENFEDTAILEIERDTKINVESHLPVIDSIDEWLTNPFTNE